MLDRRHLLALLALGLPIAAQAQGTYDSTVFAGLSWREIGIFRGGRTAAVAGSAGRALGALQTGQALVVAGS